MLALVASPGGASPVELREVPEPTASDDEAIIAVRAISLNRGEINRLADAEDGWRPGWDIAGIVAQPAKSGKGPSGGARVVGFMPAGAWAERVAVPLTRLAELPDALSFAAASTLPVAGLTALRTLRHGGLLMGRRVLITGAAGGVGRFAVQLAARADAQVTAVVGSVERGEGLRELGATEIITAIESATGPFDLILESAGGSSLAAALGLVARGGTVVTFGNSSRQDTTVNISAFYGKSGARMIGYSLLAPVLEPFGPDLAYLALLMAQKLLDPQIGYEGSWRNVGEAMAALRNRQVQGKAVLHVD